MGLNMPHFARPAYLPRSAMPQPPIAGPIQRAKQCSRLWFARCCRRWRCLETSRRPRSILTRSHSASGTRPSRPMRAGCRRRWSAPGHEAEPEGTARSVASDTGADPGAHAGFCLNGGPESAWAGHFVHEFSAERPHNTMRGLHPPKAPLSGSPRPRIPLPRPRRPRHRLRPHLHLQKENQRLHCPRRTAARHQGGRRGNLARQLHRL